MWSPSKADNICTSLEVVPHKFLLISGGVDPGLPLRGDANPNGVGRRQPLIWPRKLNENEEN